MSKIVALTVILIYISCIMERLETCFSFNINDFYHYLIPNIKLLALVIYLNLD